MISVSFIPSELPLLLALISLSLTAASISLRVFVNVISLFIIASLSNFEMFELVTQ